MPIKYKKVNKTKKVVRKSRRMNGGNRKVNRTRKVGGNRSRKVVGRSRKMSVGGGNPKPKSAKGSSAKKGIDFGKGIKMVTGYTAAAKRISDYQADYQKKKERRNRQVENFKQRVLSEPSIDKTAKGEVQQLFEKEKFRTAVLRRAKYGNMTTKEDKFKKANQYVQKSLNPIREEAAARERYRAEQARQAEAMVNRMVRSGIDPEFAARAARF